MTMARTALKILLFAVTILGTIGCGIEPKKDPPNPFVVDGVWDANSISLTCADSANCTNSLGIILTVKTETSYRYGYKTVRSSVSRCTGALYEARKVLTAGHCTEAIGSGKTFFRTVATPGRPSRTFIVTGVLKSVFNDNDRYSTDYATLEISEPATGYDFVRPPTSISPDLTNLTALVVNMPGSDNKTFNLDAVHCEVDIEGLVPFHVAEFAGLFGTKNCRIVGGNSGGPIFARGRLHEVLGVVSKSTEAGDEITNRFRELFGQRNNRLRNRATMAHAACFSLPGWAAPAPQCQMIDEQLITRKKAAQTVSLLKENLTHMFRDFQSSPEANVRLGNATIKMAPSSQSVEKRLSLSTRKNPGMIQIPRPLCLVDGTPGAVSSHSFASKVWEPDDSDGKIKFVWKGARTYGRLQLSRLGGNKWSVIYTFANPGDFKVVSKDEANLIVPSELELEPCKGNEDEELVNQILRASI